MGLSSLLCTDQSDHAALKMVVEFQGTKKGKLPGGFSSSRSTTLRWSIVRGSDMGMLMLSLGVHAGRMLASIVSDWMRWLKGT